MPQERLEYDKPPQKDAERATPYFGQPPDPKPCAFDPNPGMPVNPGTLPRRKVQVEAGVLGFSGLGFIV